MTTKTANNAVIEMIPRYRLSISGASVEACAGNRENPENIKPLRVALQVPQLFLPSHEQDEAAKRQHGEYAAGPDEIHDDGTIAAICRIVVVAEEQQIVDERTDVALARFQQ